MSVTATKAFRYLSLEEQIQRASALARQIVLTGIADLDRGRTDDNDHLPARLSSLVGNGPLSEPDFAEAWHHYYEDTQYAAYALGLAIGALLNPALVQSIGGAR
jgi:hypothetical protein